MGKTLTRQSAASGLSKSDLAREALSRYLNVGEFRRLRRKLVPLAQGRGIHTGEDVFKVLDSSILIAAQTRARVMCAGVCAELLEDVLTPRRLFTPQFILDEVACKLSEKFAIPASTVQSITNFIGPAAAKVEPAAVPDNICRNPEDIPILGTALAAEAKLPIAVDKDLLAIGEYSGIAIVKPGAFWKLANRWRHSHDAHALTSNFA